MKRNRSSLRWVTAGALGALAITALADPPSHAPAHGWRKKNDPAYAGYTGRQWTNDYGVMSGRCATEAVMATAGGVVGGIAGAQIGKGDGQVIASVIGAAVGTVLGAQIGREMSGTDHACLGHALEIAPVGKRVTWVSSGITYVVVPQGDAGKGCRHFTLASRGGAPVPAIACTRGDGRWELRRPEGRSDDRRGRDNDDDQGNGKKDKHKDKGDKGKGHGRD